MAKTDGLRTLHELLEKLSNLSRDLNGLHGSLREMTDHLLSAEHGAEDQELSQELRELFIRLETTASNLVSAQVELLSIGDRILGLLKRGRWGPGSG